MREQKYSLGANSRLRQYAVHTIRSQLNVARYGSGRRAGLSGYEYGPQEASARERKYSLGVRSALRRYAGHTTKSQLDVAGFGFGGRKLVRYIRTHGITV